MIPKTIHFIWLGGKPYPRLVEKCISSWKRHLPHYHFKKWDENNIPKDIPYIQKALQKRYYAFASDYIRLYALATEGGIYLDTDMEIVQPLDKIRHYDFLIGYQSKHSLGAGIIGSIPSHPILKNLIESYDSLQHFEPIPSMLNKANQDHIFNYDNVKLFESNYFYPYNPFDEERKNLGLMYMDITPKTYAIHHWQKSWKLSILDRWKRSLKKRNLF